MLRPTFADFAAGRETIAVIGLGYVGLPLAERRTMTRDGQTECVAFWQLVGGNLDFSR